MSSALSWLIDGSDGGLQHLLLTLIRISAVLTLAWLAHFAWRHANPLFRVLLWRTTAIWLSLKLERLLVDHGKRLEIELTLIAHDLIVA